MIMEVLMMKLHMEVMKKYNYLFKNMINLIDTEKLIAYPKRLTLAILNLMNYLSI